MEGVDRGSDPRPNPVDPNAIAQPTRLRWGCISTEPRRSRAEPEQASLDLSRAAVSTNHQSRKFAPSAKVCSSYSAKPSFVLLQTPHSSHNGIAPPMPFLLFRRTCAKNSRGLWSVGGRENMLHRGPNLSAVAAQRLAGTRGCRPSILPERCRSLRTQGVGSSLRRREQVDARAAHGDQAAARQRSAWGVRLEGLVQRRGKVQAIVFYPSTLTLKLNP